MCSGNSTKFTFQAKLVENSLFLSSEKIQHKLYCQSSLNALEICVFRGRRKREEFVRAPMVNVNWRRVETIV